MIRLCLVVTFLLLSFVILAEEPPSLRYPNSRTSKKWIESHGVCYAVDDGVTWQGLTVYLGSTELIAVEPGKEKALWLENVGAFWNYVTFKEVEVVPGKKTWAIELRARKEDDPDQKLVQYHDLKTGKKIDIAANQPSGVKLPKQRAWNGSCGVAKQFFALISTKDNYEKLWARLQGAPEPVLREELLDPEPPASGDGLVKPILKIPEVDFTNEVVLVYCAGDSANSTGVHEVESYEDEARILLRTKTSGFQTINSWVFTRDCTLFFLPRRLNKAYVLEHDVQPYIRGPALWKEKFRVKQIRGGADELGDLASPRQPVDLPKDFNRLIKAVKRKPGEPDKKFLTEFFPQYEYEYYEDPSGQAIMHGEFRAIVDTENGVKTTYKGRYQDGRKHGLWTYYKRKDEAWDEEPYFIASYHNGVLSGVMKEFSTDGKLVEEGNFLDGRAHGTWKMFHPNGKLSREQTFEHGVLNGVSRWWDAFGGKVDERTYVKGVRKTD